MGLSVLNSSAKGVHIKRQMCTNGVADRVTGVILRGKGEKDDKLAKWLTD